MQLMFILNICDIHYILRRNAKSSSSKSFWQLKLAELTSFKEMQMRFCLFFVPKTTYITSVLPTLIAKKAVKRNFLSIKIFCISS